tara:strand:+ start:5080 stop:5616 length:537 start_codon:yes stop_codon:yes gene_type:complete
MDINKLKFIHFLSAALCIELFMLFLFRFTKSPFSGKSINDWYDNFGWSAIALDVLSVIIGFYLTKYLYLYLLKKNIISEKNSLLKFLILMLTVQILHDFTFYLTVIKPSKIGKNAIMDELIKYAENVGVGAVIGDSFMYLLATPLLYYLLKLDTEENVFISLICAYIIGYIVYQKPII